jgi:hypothetical protein
VPTGKFPYFSLASDLKDQKTIHINEVGQKYLIEKHHHVSKIGSHHEAEVLCGSERRVKCLAIFLTPWKVTTLNHF